MDEAVELPRAGGILRCTAVALVLVCSLAMSSAPAAVAALPTNCTPSGLTVTCSYSYTGAEQIFLVPPGITTVHVDAIGGAGGGGGQESSVKGGKADEVTGDVSLGSQSILYVEVGGAGNPGTGTPGDTVGDYNSYPGAGGWNGGGTGGGGPLDGGAGGGGASDVRTCSRSDATCMPTGDPAMDPRLLVASGGGGSSVIYAGGDAGGGDGNPAVDPSCDGSVDPATHCTDKGRGGTSTAGGTGGAYAGSGSAGQGGTGAHVRGFSTYGGGGGGAGWFGGGGGGALSEAAYDDHANEDSASGGGGSDLVPTGGSAALTMSAAQVVITYNIVDSTPPTISIASPDDGARYDQGEAVKADYSCSDDGLGASGVASCNGPVPSGSAIDTSALGDHAFTVNATDNAGNSSSKTVHYTVAASPPAGRPASQEPAPQTLTPASHRPEPAAHVVLSHRTVKTTGGSALFTLECVGLSGQTCSGNIRLRPTSLRSRLQAAGSTSHSRAFSIPAATSLVVRVPLPTATKTRLAQRRKAVAMAVISLLGGGASKAGGTPVTIITHPEAMSLPQSGRRPAGH